jgi:YYY domain-containing protein
MLSFAVWYLIVQAISVLALPVTFRLFRWLPDRGYGLSKALGLLVSAYALWVLVSFRFLHNTRVGILFVLGVLAVFSAYLLIRQRADLWLFLRKQRRVIGVTEMLFVVGFAGWAIFRAYNPELDHTEKPMELAFLNAILRSDTFPPHDPWLAGYTISYYYFGYLIAALLTKLAGTAPAVGFNLMIALLFALTLVGAYSVTFGLVEGFRRAKEGQADETGGTGTDPSFLALPSIPFRSVLFALFGPLFVALVGNLEGLLDVLHARGLGQARFWSWLDILDISAPPMPGGWLPDRTWWWWRASRVVTQRDLIGNHVEIIDEFPFFSFLLGDMHPHVLALPFAFLALALALNIVFGTGRDEDWLPVPRLTPMALALPLIVGTFGFLHSWDFPTYLGLVTAAYGLRRYIEVGQLGGRWLRDVVAFGVWLLTLSILLFVLFHIGPRPYVGGIGLVGLAKTRLRQFVVMFGLFLFIVASALLPQLRDWWQHRRENGISVATWVVALILIPVAGLSLLLGWWTAAVLAVVIGEGLLILFHKLRRAAGSMEHPVVDDGTMAEPSVVPRFGNPVSASTLFALLLVVVGLSLTFATEFVFVQDRFGSRMNTVFKLYYQAWVMLAVASAFMVYYLAHHWRGWLRWMWLGALVVLVLISLVYPVLASYTRADRFQRDATLNGIAYVNNYQPAEYAAIRWLQANVEGAPIVLEAPGDSYRADTSRISTTTGLPTLLGWGGHEAQWRTTVPGLPQRQTDIATIYQSTDSQQVKQLIAQYGIQYVYIGPAERARYNLAPPQIEKFGTFMVPVFQQGDVVVYRR